jgi:hypothetical protein
MNIFALRLQVFSVARYQVYYGRIRGRDDCLFTILVFQHEGVSVGFLDLLRNRRIGHGAVGHQVPWIASLADAPQWFREDMHFHLLSAQFEEMARGVRTSHKWAMRMGARPGAEVRDARIPRLSF